MYKLFSVNGNSQCLDGGAMFGNVPKVLWSQWTPPDAHNRIFLACRALLIQEEHKNILLETGIGAFFEPTLRKRYGVEELEHVLLNSLGKLDLTEKDIDIVILSHLHFDHAGGLLSAWQANERLKLLFPKARYLVGKKAWERACHPHVRDRASFIPKLNQLLEQSGRLTIVEGESSKLLGDSYRFLFTDGHTPGLMHTVFAPHEGDSIIFASDLIPGTSWVHLAVSMGYDRAPELLIDEKKEMLELAIKQRAYLFYTHDPKVAMSRVIQDEKGKFVPVEKIEQVSLILS